MEVHAHTHTPRRKWTHYFWEFLMLFLAVFCGFLAEYQLEHVIEKKREKQFITSLVNDLRLDTTWLSIVTNSANLRITNIDSAITVLSGTENNEISTETYLQLRRGTFQIMYFPNNGTLMQLKSSGGMRLIRNRSVVDSIENYDRLVRRLETRRDITNVQIQTYSEVLARAVDGKDLMNVLYDSVFFGKAIAKKKIALKDQYMNELINNCIGMRLRAIGDTAANFTTKNDAVRLIYFLRKEYHLK